MDIAHRPRDKPSVQRPWLWLVPFLLAVIVGGGWYSTSQAKKGDRELPVYVRGGERMLAGEEIYRRGTDDKPFTYPPFAAVPFVPFTALSPDWQPSVWFAINFLVLLGVVLWLRRWLGRVRAQGAGDPGRGLRVASVLLVLAIAGRHVFSVFENQSNDMLVLGLVTIAAACWCRGGALAGIASGAAAGLGGAFKATPLLFGELFLLRRSWPALAALVVVFVGLGLLPDALFPRLDGRSWLVAWVDINLRGLEVGGTAAAEGAWNSHSVLNQSLSGTLTRLLSPPTHLGAFVVEDLMLVDAGGAAKIVIVLGQLLVVGLIGWGALHVHRAMRAAGVDAALRYRLGLGECGLVVLGMVLLSPQSSKSHFCVLLLPAVFCVEHALRHRRDVLLWILLAASAVLGVGTAKDLLGRELGNYVLGLGAVTWSTLLLAFATLRALRTAR